MSQSPISVCRKLLMYQSHYIIIFLCLNLHISQATYVLISVSPNLCIYQFFYALISVYTNLTNSLCPDQINFLCSNSIPILSTPKPSLPLSPITNPTNQPQLPIPPIPSTTNNTNLPISPSPNLMIVQYHHPTILPLLYLIVYQFYHLPPV